MPGIKFIYISIQIQRLIYNENEFLSVSLIHVTKAEVQEIYGVGTSFIFIGLAFVVYLAIGLATLDFSGMFDGW